MGCGLFDARQTLRQRTGTTEHTILSRSLHGMFKGDDQGRSRSSTRFNEPRLTPESRHADEDEKIHAIDECVLEETGEPRTRNRVAFHALQFRPDSSDVTINSSNQGRSRRSHLVD